LWSKIAKEIYEDYKLTEGVKWWICFFQTWKRYQ
jgi:hypothetical protein